MADERAPTAADASSRSIDPTARVQVYFQGILDSACLLYAAANAYKALTGKRVTREHWNHAIALVPDPADFLGGPGATEMAHDESRRLVGSVLAAVGDPGEVFDVERLDSTAGVAELGGEITAASVVLFAYGGPSELQSPVAHLVCGVAVSDGPPIRLHLACSTAFWSRYLTSGEYAERHHADLGRWSNDSISVDRPVTIAPNVRWRITRT